MKIQTSAFPVYIICLFFVFASCNKDSSNNDSSGGGGQNSQYTIEYKIIDANNSITSVSYNDAQENLVTINAPVQTPTEWKKAIIVTKKPFVAKLQSSVTNTSGAGISYSLIILVNGQVKHAVPEIAPTGTPVTTTAEYTVN